MDRPHLPFMLFLFQELEEPAPGAGNPSTGFCLSLLKALPHGLLTKLHNAASAQLRYGAGWVF